MAKILTKGNWTKRRNRTGQTAITGPLTKEAVNNKVHCTLRWQTPCTE